MNFELVLVDHGNGKSCMEKAKERGSGEKSRDPEKKCRNQGHVPLEFNKTHDAQRGSGSGCTNAKNVLRKKDSGGGLREARGIRFGEGIRGKKKKKEKF